MFKTIFDFKKSIDLLNKLYGVNKKNPQLNIITEKDIDDAQSYFNNDLSLNPTRSDLIVKDYLAELVKIKLSNIKGQEYNINNKVKNSFLSINKNEKFFNDIVLEWLELENEIIMFNKWHDNVIEEKLNNTKDYYQIDNFPYLVQLIDDLDNLDKSSRLFFATTQQNSLLYQGFIQKHFNEEVKGVSDYLLNKLEIIESKMTEIIKDEKYKLVVEPTVIHKDMLSYYGVLLFANLSLSQELDPKYLNKITTYHSYCSSLSLDMVEEYKGTRYPESIIKNNPINNSFFTVSIIIPTEISRAHLFLNNKDTKINKLRI